MVATFCRHIARPRQRGAATLALAITLLIAVTLIAFFSAKSGVWGQKIAANHYRWAEADQAAEAGLAYGVTDLVENRAQRVVDTNGDGFIDTPPQTRTLPDGSTYTLTYRNPTAENFQRIQIASVGTSPDGTATREIRQLMQFSPTLFHFDTTTMVVKGDVTLSGSASITNTTLPLNIKSGGAVALSGNAQTFTQSGATSSAGHIGADIQADDTALSGNSADAFFTSFFGVPSDSVKNTASVYYQNTGDTNYDTLLNGQQGTLIWIEQTGGEARLVGNTTVGTPSHPVILIVNGNLRLGGGATLYGFVYVAGYIATATGSSSIIGGLAAISTLSSLLGNFSATYNAGVLNDLQQTLGTDTPIPGSWNDLKR